MCLALHSPRQAAEKVRIAFVPDGKSTNGNAVHLLDTCRTLVIPGHIIARARRHHFHVGMASQPFGDVSRVQLGSAVDVRTVALDRDCELHDSDRSPSAEES